MSIVINKKKVVSPLTSVFFLSYLPLFIHPDGANCTVLFAEIGVKGFRTKGDLPGLITGSHDSRKVVLQKFG